MKKDIAIQNELEQLSRTVSDIPEANPFIKDIPSGYFEQLSSQIINSIRNQENEDLPESLKSVQHINVYHVDNDYFSMLDQTVKKKIDNDTKIISIKKRTVAIRYLAAAVITGLLGFGMFNLYMNHKKDASIKAETELVMKEAKEILRRGTLNQEMNTLKEDDINSYLAMNGNDVHAALVASSIDEELLPDAEEYMYNDNTLNDFLIELNIAQKTPKNN